MTLWLPLAITLLLALMFCYSRARSAGDTHSLPRWYWRWAFHCALPLGGALYLAQQARRRSRQFHVVYVSGYTEAMLERHSIDTAKGFLQKHFNLGTMGRKVREIPAGGAPAG